MKQLNGQPQWISAMLLGKRSAIALSVMAGMLLPLPALAEQPRLLAQSDVSGTSPGDIPAPIVDGVIDQDEPDDDEDGETPGTRPETSAEIVEESRQLSVELRDAYADCLASRVAVTNVPRRFARAAVSSDTCVSVECTQLNELVQEARQFLNSLNNTQRAEIQQSNVLRLW
jgi:hypothetical protein